jgi:hypothetical protein
MSHVSTFIYAFGNLAVGLFFWVRSEKLSHKVADRYSEHTINTASGAGDFQIAGFAIVGLAVMSWSIEPLCRLLWIV